MHTLVGVALALVVAFVWLSVALVAQSTSPDSATQNRPNRGSTADAAAALPAVEDNETDDSAVHVVDALRLRIAGGAVFFNEKTLVQNEADGTAQYESPEFRTASPYLAFETQPRLWPTREPKGKGSYRRVYFEGIASLRLTAIGVIGSDGSTGTGGIKVPDTSMLESQKSAQLHLGGLMSINTRGFHVRDTHFHWGFGPIYRSMFQTVTNAQRNRRVWNAEDDLYNAHTFGVRLSLYSRPGESQSSVSWTPTVYIDVTRGQFQNFELVSGKTDAADKCLRKPMACLANGTPPVDEFSIDRRWRTYIEGRVFIQSMYLGFDLNNGRGPDDLRFMAGFTLDLGRILREPS